MSDIRGWTELNSRLSMSELVAIANRYFEIVDDAVTANEGEVLKFIGDGVLAVFPTGATDDGTPACEHALAAAIHATELAAGDTPVPPIAIGMHFGEVLYGNIGSTQRLDSTVLGQAVNVTARIETLCRKFDEPFL